MVIRRDVSVMKTVESVFFCHIPKMMLREMSLYVLVIKYHFKSLLINGMISYLLIEKTYISNCSFLHIQTHCRGNLGACNVRLENPAHPVRYRGVVCSMKENFGFIERADVVKEIFFHFSEAKSMKEELRLGDDVEFIIQTRNVSKIKINKKLYMLFLKRCIHVCVRVYVYV